MRPSEAREIVALVQAAYPRHPWPDPTVALYASEIERFEDARAVAGAVRRFVVSRTEEFPPPIGQVVRAIVDARFPSFGEAWAEMAGKASTADPYDAPRFSHPAIDELARQIGWENFRLSDPLDTYFVHAAESRYRDLCEREERARVLGEPGLAARDVRELPPGLAELVEGIGDE